MVNSLRLAFTPFTGYSTLTLAAFAVTSFQQHLDSQELSVLVQIYNF